VITQFNEYNTKDLRIVRYPDAVLKQVCAPVEAFGEDLEELARRMLELMRQGNGIGLAAPQVAVPLRLFVCNHTGEPGDDMVCVNPHFVELTGGAEAEEGCLSLPAVTVTMRRATRAVMEAFDARGKAFAVTGLDLQARVWQHEAAHLDGLLISDRMSTADEIANRRAIKQLKDEYAAVQRSK